ncbi:MAG: diaminopimelate decarboxylase [Planctomycetota bacterium]
MFLTQATATQARERFGTPCYVYDRSTLEASARNALAFPNAFGFTLRFAMKSNPNHAILKLFLDLGLHIDASSDHEVERALRAGFAPGKIQLTSQAPSKNLAAHVERGVLYNACSLLQLENFGKAFPGREVSIRINAGLGSGSTNRTNVGGPGSSFGIWHERLAEARELAAKHGVKITRLHSHIGSGTDPVVWKRVARMSLGIAGQLPDVNVLNLGGGFKVARMPSEKSTDLQDIGENVRQEFMEFKQRTGRALHLEIEPGTALVANAGCVVASVIDVVDTGKDGYVFAKLDTGMNEVTRPSLYGAQHPIDVLTTEERTSTKVVFVGPCCESGDILTPAPSDPEALAPRDVPRPKTGDLVVVGGAGAYCAAMCTLNYNSYPQAPEVMHENGALRLVRKRQTFEQMLANEVSE